MEGDLRRWERLVDPDAMMRYVCERVGVSRLMLLTPEVVQAMADYADDHAVEVVRCGE